MDEIVKFEGYLERCIYSNGDYKIYALDVDKNRFPQIQRNKYDNVSLIGEMQELYPNIRYKVQATEKKDKKYGVSYNVVTISQDKPIGKEETYNFLCEILTFSQAGNLYEKYPNIVDDVIKNPNLEIDLSFVKGIKEKTFEKIKEKILDNFIFIELINEFQGMISLSRIKKLFEKYNSIERVRIEINNDPYRCMCSLSGVGFKTADKIILDMDKNGYDFGYKVLNSKQRCVSYIQYRISEEENLGNTYLSLTNLKKSVFENIPECANVFMECLKHDDFVLNKEVMGICNKNTYETEKYIADTVKEMISLKPDVLKYDKEKYRKFNDFDLTDEQLSVLDLVSVNKIGILSGYSGAGKSSSVNSLLNMLDDLKMTYILLSPTGKAAKVLANMTGRIAQTIHRGLAYRPPEWGYNEYLKLKVDVVILDEMSMVDIFLFKHLLEAIDINRTRLLMIGDPAQLPSVSCGNVLHDLLNCKVIPTVLLEKIFRYADGGLMKCATDVRNCTEYLGEIATKTTVFGDNQDYIFIQSSNNQTSHDVVALYKALLEHYKVEDVQILTAYKVSNNGTIELNKKVQKIANKDYENKNSITVGETTFYEDDLIIQNINNYNAQTESGEVLIPNGETGKIIKIDNDMNTIIINFDGEVVEYHKADLTQVSLGYAISIHKSEGSTIPIVLLSTPAAQMYMLSSNLVYVGMTRTKKKCYHIGDKNIINKIIKKKDNMQRKTLLQKLLVRKC